MKLAKNFFVGFLFFFISFYCLAQPPKGIKWSNDGTAYYASESGEIVKYQLPGFTKTTIASKAILTPTGKSALAIRNFFISEDESKVLIYTNSKKVWRYDTKGDYYLADLNAKIAKQIGKSLPASSLMFAKISPDGKQIAYVSSHNIYVEDIATSTVKQLTKDGTAKLINGTFDWVYEEEFGCRDGFRWSPDSKSIAFWQIDATNIKNFLMLNTTDSIYSFTVPVEYPKVGEDPSSCKIGVVNIATAKTTWMSVPGSAVQNYIPRMEWTNNSNEIIIQQLNRRQQESKIMLLNAKTGTAKTIYSEEDKAWIDIKSTWNDGNPAGWEWLNGGKDFLWVSEKDGWRHIYKVSMDGKNETLLTKGNYDMIAFEAIDEKNGYVYFMASPNNALQQYLYRSKLDGTGTAELVSSAAQNGTHRYQMSPTASFAKHNFSSSSVMPSEEWVKLPTNEVIKAAAKRAIPPVPTEASNVSFIQITTEDGITMDGWRVLPTDFDSTKKYPVLFFVYTEPGATTVSDNYGSAGFPYYNGDMAGDGYIQISLDGRGTPSPKGAAWRKSIYKKVGILNIRDQAMAAKKILEWKYVDKDRIAVAGWSGGGSTTLNLMFQYPEIYKTGIAVAPVANRLSYDNIYEERYMGLPQDNNKEDYIKASAINYAKGLKGNLLVIHGTGDDNVHYQNTEMLINELVKNNKQFSMMSYPNRTHSISEGRGTSAHLYTLITNYIKQHCPGGGK